MIFQLWNWDTASQRRNEVGVCAMITEHFYIKSATSGESKSANEEMKIEGPGFTET